MAAQAGQPALDQRTARDRVGDEGIAVAVAADPGAEAEGTRLGGKLDTEFGEARTEPAC